MQDTLRSAESQLKIAKGESCIHYAIMMENSKTLNKTIDAIFLWLELDAKFILFTRDIQQNRTSANPELILEVGAHFLSAD